MQHAETWTMDITVNVPLGFLDNIVNQKSMSVILVLARMELSVLTESMAMTVSVCQDSLGHIASEL
jgi:hypothetical protein